MEVYDRDGKPIVDWRGWTRPKKDAQWRAGRSAMELARAWFTSRVPATPPEIRQLLDSNEMTAGAQIQSGWPELVTPLPFRGEGRNHDLVLMAELRGEPLLITVEGKVDETMGPAIGAYWTKSRASERSNAWRRVDALLTTVFGPEARATDMPWSGLPYQMLTALVGTAIEARARSCPLAVLCVHELLTESAKPLHVHRNEADFRIFLAALGVPDPIAGKLYGPYDVLLPNQTAAMPVLIGKAQFHWAAR